jgi:sugar O-acyltransferase (sialic acid O-acetyltransferase NeuD family)
MANVILFGLLDTASLAHFYLQHDSEHKVVAFSVHQEYLPTETTFEGLPIVPFEEVERAFAPADHRFFAPMTARNMNRLRESVYNQIKEKKYSFISYVSSRATVFPEAIIGENCFILEDNTIQPYTPIGNNVVLWSGNHIGHHGIVKDHVFFTSHVVLSGHCVVEPYCFLGVNATIRDYTHLAEGSLIGMGALVTKDTEPWGVYTGAPARKGPKLSNDLDF